MTEETKATEAAPAAPTAQPGGVDNRGPRRPFRRGGRGGRPGQGGDRRDGRGGHGGRGDRGERKQEFDQKTISVRRVARVVSGGRRFSFSVAVIAGDRKGRVGVGLGKATDTAAAIDKAMRDAKKHMIKVPMTSTKSIAKDIEGKHAASRVVIRPAKNRGLVAGASVRLVLELAGVTDVTSKVLSRSRNKLNNARAAIDALKSLN